MLLKCQACILNLLYETNIFQSIVLPHQPILDINYHHPLQLYQQHISKSEFTPFQSSLISYAHVLCKSESMQQKKEGIFYMNKMIGSIQTCAFSRRSYSVLHVIIFSSLSKCTIWPGMFKTSKKLIPSLIEFYSKFFQEFKDVLQYKFDPLILSSKYSKIVRQIKEKKTAFPELFAAVEQNNHEDIVKLSKQDKQILNTVTNNARYLCHHAASSASLPTLRLLLSMGMDYQLLDEQKQTAIFYAIKRFDLEIIRFFVEEVKVNINHTQYQNRTPIYLAAFQGNLQIVEYLYLHGGNPQIESKLSRTPLSKACYLGNVKVAEFLIKLGVKIDSVDSKGRTALHNAAWGKAGGREGKRRGNVYLQDSPECVELLIKAGHFIDFQDFDKFTPLFSAISSHAERSLKLLVHLGANISHKTKKNETAVFIACKYGHLQILKILIQDYNCDYLQQNINSYSPFDASLTTQDNSCTHYLLNLFLKNGKKGFLTIKSLMCVEQFDCVNKFRYLLQWLEKGDNQEQKCGFVGENVLVGQEIAKYVWNGNHSMLKQMFIELIVKLKDYLSDSYLQLAIENICQHQYYTNASVLLIVNTQKHHKSLPLIHLNPKLTEPNIIKLLSINSNLTESIESLYQTTIDVIKYRFTKVLIYILNLIVNQRTSEKRQGIFRFSSKDIMLLFFTKVEGKSTLLDHCLINGYYDLHKIIASFYNEYYEFPPPHILKPPNIPNYQYSSSPIPEFKSYLHPLNNINQLLSFEMICKTLSEAQLNIYKKVRKEGKIELKPVMVCESLLLQKMIQKLQSSRLIGIDVEHYSTSEESFICLIQIATLEEVFIIDTFSYIHDQVKSYLRNLFSNENILKIFHSYDNDLKWIAEHFQIYNFHHIIDTAKLYLLFEGHKINTPSLKTLANIFLHMEMNKEYQRCDWRIRPLFEEMIDYAALDAKILPFLYLRMVQTVGQEEKGIKSLLIKKSLEQKRIIKGCSKRYEVILNEDNC